MYKLIRQLTWDLQVYVNMQIQAFTWTSQRIRAHTSIYKYVDSIMYSPIPTRTSIYKHVQAHTSTYVQLQTVTGKKRLGKKSPRGKIRNKLCLQIYLLHMNSTCIFNIMETIIFVKFTVIDVFNKNTINSLV